MGSRHSPEREIAFAMTRRIMGPEDAKTEQMQNNCRIDRGKPIQDWVPVQINDLDTAEYTSAPPRRRRRPVRIHRCAAAAANPGPSRSCFV